jgi:hypothetical protein
MTATAKRVTAIYADKSGGQWIVRDRDGNFWSLPTSANPWDERQPYTPAEDDALEPVPKHYQYLLGLPL